MAASSESPVADFWAELKNLVIACQVKQEAIARALGLASTSSVSDLLSGKRRTPPAWEDVEKIVILCAQRHGPKTPPPGMSLDPKWWRTRHAGLDHRAVKVRDQVKHAPAQSAPHPTPDAMAVADMGVEDAVQLLGAGRMKWAVHALMNPPPSEHVEHRVLEQLLKGFPERVHAAHGARRSALLQAARVVLAAAAVVQCTSSNQDTAQPIRDLADDVHMAFVAPLAVFRDTIEARKASRIIDAYLRQATPLAAACPEFALVASVPRAGRAGPATTGLAGLEILLSGLSSSAGWADPSIGHGALLRSPIASLDSPGPRLPSLAEGYITPRFRLAGKSPTARAEIASDKWWDEQPLNDDIEGFLAAHVLCLPGLLAPLVVLGHPGAGKSLLTKLLTARLPLGEFRPLRVELRYTPAELDVQAQLEHALKRATGREVSWPDWSEQEPGQIPVALLDGFDELIQAGAQRLGQDRQWGYLREVEEFQQREARNSRPLIVIVTSRTVVADRADIPRASQVVRLEPFDEQEINRWLAVWNTTNADYFDRHPGLLPLTPDVVLPHHDLAAQPLLLLMLALYDAVDNALHLLRNEEISRTELYDRLLTEFVRRQVEKDGPRRPAQADTDVDRELHRLSAVAISMFHRGAQSISEAEADRDLRALGAAEDSSDLLFGRFFFVHEAQAVITEERLRSYEFLHATFGEHLAARLIERALRRLVEGESPRDDGELYALLSFAPLTDRAQLVQNLRDMLETWSTDRSRGSLLPTLLSLFREASWDPEHRTDVEYAPVRVRRRYREAVYEVNLVLIAVLVAGEMYASDLFDDALAPTGDWRRLALGWQAQLSIGSWAALTSALAPEHCWRARGKAMEEEPDLRLITRTAPLIDHDLNWSLGVSPPDASRSLEEGLEERLSDTQVPDLIRQVRFVADRNVEMLLHISYPMLLQSPSAMSGFVLGPGNTYHSAAQALTALLTRDVYRPEELPGLYMECLGGVNALKPEEHGAYLEAVQRQLVHDAPTLADAALAEIIKKLCDAYDLDSTPLSEAAYRALLLFLRHAVDRASPHLAEPLNRLRLMASVGERISSRESLLELSLLSQSAHTWRWSGGFDHRAAATHYLDDLLESLDLSTTATVYPTALINLLRLAAELGLDHWLTTNAPKILDACPRHAFGLLRPSDLRSLRNRLPKNAFAKQFEEVEEAWRAHK